MATTKNLQTKLLEIFKESKMNTKFENQKTWSDPFFTEVSILINITKP